ncbi:hypothetical protein, partial [Vibrio vulnificus]|uniref:hypothetical protein n=1 Tax=Vibrio vulnificus TaxID=672 RepID=UPI0024E007ED
LAVAKLVLVNGSKEDKTSGWGGIVYMTQRSDKNEGCRFRADRQIKKRASPNGKVLLRHFFF